LNLVGDIKEDDTEHNDVTENCKGWKKLDYKSKEGHCNAQPQLLTLFQSLSTKTKQTINIIMFIIIIIQILLV